MEDEKVTLEVAETEFKRFAESWGIDANTDKMSGEDKESFDQQKSRIVNQIIPGNAVVDEDGNITYTLQHSEGGIGELTFKVPKGDAYMAMDQYKDRQTMHKMYAFMGAMTKQSPKLFSSMDARDVKFCQGVTLLFLGS